MTHFLCQDWRDKYNSERRRTGRQIQVLRVKLTEFDDSEKVLTGSVTQDVDFDQGRASEKTRTVCKKIVSLIRATCNTKQQADLVSSFTWSCNLLICSALVHSFVDSLRTPTTHSLGCSFAWSCNACLCWYKWPWITCIY